MPLWRDEIPSSKGTAATLVVITAVGVASMSRVFDGPRYLLWAVPAVVIGAGVALVFGRRSLGRALTGLALGWAVTLPALFASDKTYSYLPTAAGFRAVRSLFTSGFGGAGKALPPVAAQPRYLILLWTSFIFLGFLGASWVIVRRPIGAVISALGVVVFAGGVGAGPGRNGYAFAAVASTGAFFLSEGRHRIQRWGRSRVPMLFGVPTLAVASLFALAAPVLFGESPVFNLRAALRPRLVIIKPLSDVRRQLKVDPPVEVMRVIASRPTYWRLTGLDSYDGTEWVLRARPSAVREGRLPAPDPPATGDVLTQQYRLTSLLAPWLPAAYAATAIDIETGAQVEVDDGSQTLLLRGETSPGLVYTVDSRQPQVSQNVVAAPHRSSDPREQLFGRVAQEITKDARTPLDAARRLEAHFKAFDYDEDVAGGHTVQRLQRFLTERRGYCEQFAATMTLMLRGLGYEARVGVGFLPGSLAGRDFVVSTRDAHAWVEANIPQAGWVSFDPTPDRGGLGAVPPSREELPQEASPPPAASIPPAPTPEAQELPEDVTERELAGIPVGRFVPYALAALALAAIPGAKRARRMRRRRASDAALGAYAEFVDRAADLGWRQRVTETHREFASRLFLALDEGRDAATQLVDVTTRALFGPSPTDVREMATAWEALPVALTHLRRHAPLWRRALAVLDPRTFIPAGWLARLRPIFLRLRPA